jgi:hypothetical protein
MSAPTFNILTQKELTIDLSRPAMAVIINAIETREPLPLIDSVQCELDNFCNTLQNLLERSEPKPENSDLIGA